MALVVWIVAATALWHFSVLVPDRFYGGIIGALLAANAGALLVGLSVSATTGWPPSFTTGLIDVGWGLLGALIGLGISYAVGRRYDPVTGTSSSEVSGS
jgi:hypothetical protein